MTGKGLIKKKNSTIALYVSYVKKMTIYPA